MSHWFGIAGELLNLLGAIILVLDVILREQEHELEVRLVKLVEIARTNKITSTIYRGCNLLDKDFVRRVLYRRSVRIAYWGVVFLFLGFLCLGIHHGMEIHEGRKVADWQRQERRTYRKVRVATISDFPTLLNEEQFNG